MFTLTITILAVLTIAAVLLRIGEAITVESYTISTRDCPNIDGPSDALYRPVTMRPSPNTGGAR